MSESFSPTEARPRRTDVILITGALTVLPASWFGGWEWVGGVVVGYTWAIIVEWAGGWRG